MINKNDDNMGKFPDTYFFDWLPKASHYWKLGYRTYVSKSWIKTSASTLTKGFQKLIQVQRKELLIQAYAAFIIPIAEQLRQLWRHFLSGEKQL